MDEKQIKKLSSIFLVILVLIFVLIIGNLNKDSVNIYNENTGIMLKEKIYCQPKDKTTKELYNQNKITLKGLPECENFNIFNAKTTTKNGIKPIKGFFNKIIVVPLTFLTIKIGLLFHNYIAALVFLIIIKSIFILRSNYKTFINNRKIKNVNDDIQKIANKFNKDSDYWTEDNPYNENVARVNYTDELKQIYKKNNIKPVSGCIVPFIQIPILLAFLRILYSVPVILESKIFGLSLGASPKILSKINPVAISIVVILLFITTFLNAIISTEKKFNLEKSNIIMALVISSLILSASTSFPLGVALYFIISDIINCIGKLLIYKKSTV